MEPTIPLVLKLLSEVMEFVNDHNTTKHIRRIVEIEMDLYQEKQKHPDCDDRLIADLINEKKILEQAAYQEWLAFKAKGKS